MIKLLRRRDFKENELAGQQAALGACDIRKEQAKVAFNRNLDNYQNWKKENKIDGIRY